MAHKALPKLWGHVLLALVSVAMVQPYSMAAWLLKANGLLWVIRMTHMILVDLIHLCRNYKKVMI